MTLRVHFGKNPPVTELKIHLSGSSMDEFEFVFNRNSSEFASTDSHLWPAFFSKATVAKARVYCILSSPLCQNGEQNITKKTEKVKLVIA